MLRGAPQRGCKPPFLEQHPPHPTWTFTPRTSSVRVIFMFRKATRCQHGNQSVTLKTVQRRKQHVDRRRYMIEDTPSEDSDCGTSLQIWSSAAGWALTPLIQRNKGRSSWCMQEHLNNAFRHRSGKCRQATICCANVQDPSQQLSLNGRPPTRFI